MATEKINKNIKAKLDISVAAELNDFLCTFAWSGTHLDWRILKHKHVYWHSNSEKQVAIFIRDSFPAKCDYIAVLCSTKQPLSIISLDFVAENLELVMDRFQQCFLFEAFESKGHWQIIKNNFVEAEYFENLWSWRG